MPPLAAPDDQALRRGESETVGLLPDRVPPGLGLWSPVFGKPAYTMTLAARLARQTGATVLLVRCEREPMGRGFVIIYRSPCRSRSALTWRPPCLQVNRPWNVSFASALASTCGAMAATSSPEPMPQRRRPRHDESAGCGGSWACWPVCLCRCCVPWGRRWVEVLFVLVVPRRRSLRNLELCFPQASVEQRTRGRAGLYRLLPDLAGSQLAVVRPSVGGGAAREAPGRCA